MRTKNLLSIAILLTTINCFAQNYIYKGDNRYKSTKTWEFSINGSSWDGILKVSVAKTNTGGYLWLSTGTSDNNDLYIKGNITIFLEDGTTIKCIDRNIRDNVDNNAISLYVLSKSEIQLLKWKRIYTIRFIIQEHYDLKNTTADNKVHSSIYGSENKIGKYETETEIFNLFEL